MLDAYIIDRIRRERDQSERRNSQLPLHIEPPPERKPAPPPQPQREDPEHGSVVIDFQL